MNLVAIAKTLQTIVGLIPAIQAAVKAVEVVVPAGTPGADKLEVLKTGLQTAFEVEQNIETTFDQIWPAVKTAVALTVTKFHLDGTFPPKTTAAQPQ